MNYSVNIASKAAINQELCKRIAFCSFWNWEYNFNVEIFIGLYIFSHNVVFFISQFYYTTHRLFVPTLTLLFVFY